MSRQIKIFVAGMLIVAPFAITIGLIWSAGQWLDSLPSKIWEGLLLPRGVGAAAVIVSIYLIGLLTHFWLFRWIVGLVERLFQRLPGVKTIYQSVRDLMQLFGGNSTRMGRAVIYRPPGTEMSILGILTNERPSGLSGSPAAGCAALYVPYSYMFGGLTIYVNAAHIHELDVTVEQALKLAATAQVGSDAPAAPVRRGR